MSLKEIILDIICTEFPMNRGALLSQVLSHPKYNYEKYEKSDSTFSHIQKILDMLVSQDILNVSGGLLSPRYYRIMAPPARSIPALRKISFTTAKRYLNRYRGWVFISCAHGDGWKLYRYIEKSKPGMVGNEGRKRELVASLTSDVKNVGGTYWTNPSQER